MNYDRRIPRNVLETAKELARARNHDAQEGLKALEEGDLEEALDLFDAAAEVFDQREDKESADEARWLVEEIDSLL